MPSARLTYHCSAQGVPIMTLESVKAACVENGGYETAELNETLYLSFKGYRSITQEISAFTGALVLYLESNGITKIENVGTRELDAGGGTLE